ncbi:TPA: hypothetical protein ACFNMX_002144 [Neisseria lactamica]|uniref:hypothetical protein n=1 Tax=Neisseria lactamica TaxID=486 RepID=UPI0005060FA6|nr:hypothetical protein [Neisseria lactamica]KFJ36228.1 hypothetical protein DR91_2 [Neisseria lactamica ATCC 23970]
MISDFCKLFISSQDKNLISAAIENFFKSPLINGKYIETEMLDIYFLIMMNLMKNVILTLKIIFYIFHLS